MVSKYLLVLAIALVLGGSRADAAVIDFNGLSGIPIPTVLGVDIGLLNFSSNPAGPIVVLPQVGITTSDSLLLNGADVTIKLVSGGAFNLEKIDAFGSVGTLVTNFGVFGAGFDVNGETLTSVNPAFLNLTSITISSSAVPVLLDNITFSVVVPAAVPEPASAAFLGLGSLALVVRRMRRRSSVAA